MLYRYIIPGKDGSLEPGSRLLNFAWYQALSETSPTFREAMTDANGKTHRTTLPIGKMAPKVWAAQKEFGKRILPDPIYEVVEKIEQLFITACYSTLPIRASFLDGQLLLVGDALSQFTPNAGASTNQGARNALGLMQVLRGELSLEKWEKQQLSYAHVTRLFALSWGSGYLSSYPVWWYRVARHRLAVTMDRYWSLD